MKVLYFKLESSSICKTTDALLAKIAKENKDLEIKTINVAKSQKEKNAYKVIMVPTVVKVDTDKKQTEIARITGVAVLAGLTDFLNE